MRYVIILSRSIRKSWGSGIDSQYNKYKSDRSDKANVNNLGISQNPIVSLNTTCEHYIPKTIHETSQLDADSTAAVCTSTTQNVD